MRRALRRGVPLAVLAAVAVVAAVPPAASVPGHGTDRLPALQPLIDAAPPGSVLHLAPGRYAAPARIDKPLLLDGGGAAALVGDGSGTVLELAGEGVTVRGLRVAGSGDSHDRVDAGIVATGRGHRIEGNVLEDVLFGIHLRQASGSVVRGNAVTGKDLTLGLRGDALRVWNGQGNRIEGNRFERARDLTFANAPDNLLAGNRFRDGRYGLHVVFSPRLRVEGNDIADTGTGLIVLYSPEVSLRGNRIAHALTGGGAGIVFKESDSGVVVGNQILHCAVGLKVDAPPEARQGEALPLLQVTGNRFAHNLIGLFFYGEAGGHRFEDNRFENNLTTVAISGEGAGSANVWRRNRWDEYQGFDRDGDGTGDTPHEAWIFADRIWMENPMATFFRNSPALELLDFLERLAPFARPYRVLRDDAPRLD